MLFLRSEFWAPTLIIYFLLHTLIRAVLGDPLTADEINVLQFASTLRAQYDGMGPLYPWLQYCFIQLLGASAVSIALLKNLILLTTCILVHRMVSRVAEAHWAWLATLSLIFLPQTLWKSQVEMSPTILATCFAVAMVVVIMALYRAQLHARFLSLGALAGLGFLADQNFIWVIVALGLAAMTSAQFRPILQNPWILVTVLLAAALSLAPRLVAIGELPAIIPVYPMEMALDRGLIASRISQTQALVQVGITLAVLFLIGLCIAVYRDIGEENPVSDDLQALRQLLSRSITLGLIALFGAIGLSGITLTDTRTVQPLLIFIAPLAALYLYPVVSPEAKNHYTRLAGILAVGMLIFSAIYFGARERDVAGNGSTAPISQTLPAVQS